MSFSQWTAGQRVTAARLASMTTVYSAWTPAWTTSSGAASPSYGNATVDCRYAQTGNLVVANIRIVFGGTTNFGGGATTSDNWRFALPVTAAATTQGVGFVELNFSTSSRFVGRWRIATTSLLGIDVSSGSVDGTAAANSGEVDSLTPETWASGDAITGNIMYEAA